MTGANKHLFNFLKEKIAATFLEENHASKSIKNWKGDEIIAFQEDLFSKNKGRISEKSFYTYFKNEPKNLPRIDMLNLLSSYAGYENWNEFKTVHSGMITEELSEEKNKKKISPLLWAIIFLPLLIIIFVTINNDNEFTFCMIDEDKNEAITTIPLDIKILQEGESPIHIRTDSTGCFTHETKEDFIKFVVKSPYHKTDTITRFIDSNENSTVKLATDDYALMLKYYASGDVKDVDKRRQQLSNLIAENAQIYQMYPKSTGVELYSKSDFIAKMTIPTSSLKNIQILDKTYENGKIVKLKFMVR